MTQERLGQGEIERLLSEEDKKRLARLYIVARNIFGERVSQPKESILIRRRNFDWKASYPISVNLSPDNISVYFRRYLEEAERLRDAYTAEGENFKLRKAYEKRKRHRK